ncbi:MAG: phage baseplate assembly protein V [Ferruginibacter sp.]
MEYLVIAEIEIDGTSIKHYTSIMLRQKFNAHHEFIIRINHDILEELGSFGLDNAKTKIGKSAIIRLQQLDISLEIAYEFKGIICEVRMEQSGNSNSDLVMIGYSPTILLENGQHLASFNERDLKKIVQTVTKPLSNVNCKVIINNHYTKQVNYICQYKESGFHFINRLSSEFSEFFYYDGKNLNFGKPASTNNIDITYGEDVSSMELSLQTLPVNFSNFSYISKENKVEEFDAPSAVDELGQFGSYLLKQSDDLFPGKFNLPIRQRIENKSDLENFVKKQKAALAVSLEVLTGRSYNPRVVIGAVINVKVSKLKGNSFKQDDFGKYLVISVEHCISENGSYYNMFEAVPSVVEALPVKNIRMPVAEPQIAIVKNNTDPENSGRVRVQMLWQKGNEMTDWIRVMTPDAGPGKDNAKNRGLVTIPETGDQVLIAFRYNDPDRPFVMGSLFHGKSGGGGGNGNKIKSLTALSGSTVTFDDNAISIIDAGGNKVVLDGDGNIDVVSSKSIKLTCGDSSIELKKDGTINIQGKQITIAADEKAKIASGQASFTADGQGNEAKMEGMKAAVNGNMEVKISGGAKTEVSASGNVAVKATLITLN